MSGVRISWIALRARVGLHLLAVLAFVLAGGLDRVETLVESSPRVGRALIYGNGLTIAVGCLAAAGIVARDNWQRACVANRSLLLIQLTRLLMLSVFQLALAQLMGLWLTGDLTLVPGTLLAIALPALLASALGLALLRFQHRWRVGALVLLAGSLVLPALPRFELEALNLSARAFDFLAPLRWLARSSDTMRVASCYVATVSGLLGLAWLLPRSVAR